MSQDLIIALQSLLIFLQIVNTGIATVTHDPVVSLLISAGVGGFSYYVNHLGNHSVSPEVNAILTPEQKTKIVDSTKPLPKAEESSVDTEKLRPIEK